MYGNALIKNRDVVGYGNNGEPVYFGTAHLFFKSIFPLDIPITPCPAIRFKENTPEVLKLREKEMKDWKNLSIEEKKELFDNVPSTYTREYQEGMLKQIIESGQHPITGPSSRWDFENRKWKN
ncbi:unnamed protein product [Gordionus sp. m RMFG-2023]